MKIGKYDCEPSPSWPSITAVPFSGIFVDCSGERGCRTVDRACNIAMHPWTRIRQLNNGTLSIRLIVVVAMDELINRLETGDDSDQVSRCTVNKSDNHDACKSTVDADVESRSTQECIRGCMHNNKNKLLLVCTINI